MPRVGSIPASPEKRAGCFSHTSLTYSYGTSKESCRPICPARTATSSDRSMPARSIRPRYSAMETPPRMSSGMRTWSLNVSSRPVRPSATVCGV